jgi:hypothetical protein
MKTATLPTLRVEPGLRKSAEAVLRPGESLSGFVAEAVQRNVARRRADVEFLNRGLAHREEARRTADYVSPEQTLVKLERMLKPHVRRKASR